MDFLLMLSLSETAYQQAISEGKTPMEAGRISNVAVGAVKEEVASN